MSVFQLLHLLGQGRLGEVHVNLRRPVVGVPQYPLHHIPDDPGLYHLGGRGVAQIVEVDVLDAALSGNPFEPVADRVRVERMENRPQVFGFTHGVESRR